MTDHCEQDSTEEAPSEPGFRFQYSLRTFLIATLAIGAGGGILGQLFLRSPEMFQIVAGALATVVPFLLAIGTIAWLGVRRRRWGLVVWGGLLLAMPLFGYALVMLAESLHGSGPRKLGMFSTQEVIDQRLDQGIDEPWIWRELEGRIQAGTMSNEEVDAALKKLIAHMKKTKPQGFDSPLHWQDDFLKTAVRRKMISEEVMIDLCDAFFGPAPSIEPLARPREGQDSVDFTIQYGSNWAAHSGIPLGLIWDVDQVLLDGNPVEATMSHRHGGSWTGRFQGELSVGQHELTVRVECAYVDVGKLVGINGSDLRRKLWPKETRKQWKQEVSAPLNVYAKDAQIVSLVTDPKLSPGGTGGVRFKRLIVQPDPKGKKIIFHSEAVGGVVLSISYDVTVQLGEESVALGHLFLVTRDNGSISSGFRMEKQIDRLDPSIQTADVILTPNGKHVEQYPAAKQIWGRKVVIPDVSIERLDLETREAAGGP